MLTNSHILELMEKVEQDVPYKANTLSKQPDYVWYMFGHIQGRELSWRLWALCSHITHEWKSGTGCSVPMAPRQTIQCMLKQPDYFRRHKDFIHLVYFFISSLSRFSTDWPVQRVKILQLPCLITYSNATQLKKGLPQGELLPLCTNTTQLDQIAFVVWSVHVTRCTLHCMSQSGLPPLI